VSSALAYALRDQKARIDQMEKRLLDLESRLKEIEDRPRPGRPPKNKKDED